jgi:hypothetical protein
MHLESVGPRTIKAVPIVAVVVLLFTGFRPISAMGQATQPALVFKPALERIQAQVRIPILLPSRLPVVIREKDIKLAWGEMREDGYFISLYYSEPGVGATYAAGFGGSTRIEPLFNSHRVELSDGRTGMFRPVSCGGSCAPANLWWEHSGVMYQIQIKLNSSTTEKEQERILVETANSTVSTQRK